MFMAWFAFKFSRSSWCLRALVVRASDSVACGFRAGQYRFDDAVIAGAATQVAVQFGADLSLARLRVASDQIDGAHHHPRRAVAALQAVMVPERRLHRVHAAVGTRYALDGDDIGAVSLRCKHVAALHRVAVHVYGTGAALRGVAADVRAREAQGIANEVDQQNPRFQFCGNGLAVPRHLYFDEHEASSVVGPRRPPMLVKGRRGINWIRFGAVRTKPARVA